MLGAPRSAGFSPVAPSRHMAVLERAEAGLPQSISMASGALAN